MSGLPVQVRDWRDWTLDDYAKFFLTDRAARARLKPAPADLSYFSSTDEFFAFLRPVRHRIQDRFGGSCPRLSILIRAHNEERELLPTLVSYAFAVPPFAAPTEIIVVNNCSTDHTDLIAEATGVRRVYCSRKGIGHATKAGYEAIAPTSEYIFITDADVRLTRPFSRSERPTESTVLLTSYSYLEANAKCMGVSTGMVYETSHWLHRTVRASRCKIRGGSLISYWTGPNQFFRRCAIDGAGGINENVKFGYGEDFCRLYSVARYCRANRYDLTCGGDAAALIDPVYQSGRRFATLSQTIKNALFIRRTKKRRIADDGWPLFEENMPIEKEEVRI